MSTPPRIVLEVPREPSLEDGPWSPRWPEQVYYYDGRPRLLDEEQGEPRSSLETIATPYTGNTGEPKRDPDLVSHTKLHATILFIFLPAAAQLDVQPANHKQIGNMERPKRPRESQELAQGQEMGHHDGGLSLHLHLARVVVHGGASTADNGARARHQK